MVCWRRWIVYVWSWEINLRSILYYRSTVSRKIIHAQQNAFAFYHRTYWTTAREKCDIQVPIIIVPPLPRNDKPRFLQETKSLLRRESKHQENSRHSSECSLLLHLCEFAHSTSRFTVRKIINLKNFRYGKGLLQLCSSGIIWRKTSTETYLMKN